MEKSDRRRDMEKRENRRSVEKEGRQNGKRERENVFDRQSKFQWEEVTEERMQTKEREGGCN